MGKVNICPGVSYSLGDRAAHTGKVRKVWGGGAGGNICPAVTYCLRDWTTHRRRLAQSGGMNKYIDWG